MEDEGELDREEEEEEAERGAILGTPGSMRDHL
jgi:hypothetical protein